MDGKGKGQRNEPERMASEKKFTRKGREPFLAKAGLSFRCLHSFAFIAGVRFNGTRLAESRGAARVGLNHAEAA